MLAQAPEERARASARRSSSKSLEKLDRGGQAVKKALKDHLGDFVAILALVVLALGIGGYILSNQRLRFPLVQDKPFMVKVELPDAQAVQPGQGQTVRIAGVEIGQIGKVELKDGKAVVELQLEPKYKGYIKRGRHRAAAHQDRPEGHVHRGRSRQGQGHARGRDASRRPTRRRTSTPTRCSARWTPTPATTCSCWSPAPARA